MRYGLAIVVVILFANALAPPASAQPTRADAGRQIFEQRCVGCHAATNARAADVAPPVTAIAEKATNEDYVRGRMLSPHPPMPDFALSRRDIEDLLAYFASVRGR
jgi:mono/diheme cytochrome c family protein